VVRSLLDLARLEQYEFLPTDVNDTIRKALDLVKHEIISRSIGLTSSLTDGLPLVRGSQNHLQGVWVNLLVNAIDAVSEENGSIRIATAQKDREIHITVADNGMGIPPEQIGRIFDPFYTTKSRGEGTGLGLSVCDRTIKQHGGRILVNSQPDEGTTFTVLLPIG
jgi:signal transduction histidine kinase